MKRISVFFVIGIFCLASFSNKTWAKICGSYSSFIDQILDSHKISRMLEPEQGQCPLTWLVANRKKSDTEIFVEAVATCSPKKMHPHADNLLKDLSWLKFKPSKNDGPYLNPHRRLGEATYLGHNTYAVNCTHIEGGLNRLSQLFTDALKQGLSCLSTLGKNRVIDAGRFLRFFDDKYSAPLVIRCEKTDNEYLGTDMFSGPTTSTTPEALPCTNDQFPSIYMTRFYLRPEMNEIKIKATLFHEATHLLGYLHSGGSQPLDVTRQIEACCFPGSIDLTMNAHLNLENSCEKLRRLNWNIE